MSLLFEALQNIGKKIEDIPPLEAAMRRLQSGGTPDDVEGEICSLYLDLKRMTEKCK